MHWCTGERGETMGREGERDMESEGEREGGRKYSSIFYNTDDISYNHTDSL